MLSYVAVTFPFWQAENWTTSQEWLSLNDHGFVTILQSGLYMVYAQVTTRGVCQDLHVYLCFM